jgi:hypothetical protein
MLNASAIKITSTRTETESASPVVYNVASILARSDRNGSFQQLNVTHLIPPRSMGSVTIAMLGRDHQKCRLDSSKWGLYVAYPNQGNITVLLFQPFLHNMRYLPRFFTGLQHENKFTSVNVLKIVSSIDLPIPIGLSVYPLIKPQRKTAKFYFKSFWQNIFSPLENEDISLDYEWAIVAAVSYTPT